MKRMLKSMKRFGGDMVYRMLDVVFTNRFKIVKMHEKNTGKERSVLYQANRVPKDYAVITREIEDVYALRRGSVVIDSIEKYRRSKSDPVHKPSAAVIARDKKFQFNPTKGLPMFKNKHGHPEQVDLKGLNTSLDGRV